MTMEDDKIETINELLFRLQKDRNDIQKKFGINKTERVVSLERLNDRTEYWRLCFESGTGLIYKPKCLSMDVAYESFAKLTDMGLSAVKSLDFIDYGWQEFIESSERVLFGKEYYYSAGVLLGTTYLLGAHDYHAGNIMLKNGLPTPIDNEMLLFPRWYEDENNKSSVISTCLLPEQIVDSKGNVYEIGGLYFPKNLPLDIALFEEFVSGFKKSISKIKSLSENDLNNCFASARVRVVLRASQIYNRLCEKIDEKGEKYYKRIEVILRRKDLPKDIVKYEMKCLRECTIPYFWMYAGSKDLMCGNEIAFHDFSIETPIENAINNIRNHINDGPQIELLKKRIYCNA